MSNQGNNGFRSKFQQRLKRMKFFRMLKFKNVKDNDNNKDFILEVVSNIRNTSNDRFYSRKKVGVVDNNKENNKFIVNISKELNIKDKEVVESINLINSNKEIIKSNDSLNKELNIKENKNYDNTSVKNDLDEKVKYVKENKPKINRNKRVGYVVDNKSKLSNVKDNEKHDILNDMGTNIINKLKDSFNDKLDELEVLHSELYILSNYQDSELELKKVKEIKKRINELIDRINEIIEQYNLYKKNYYIDNVIGIDDSIIVDDIINYRNLLDSFNDEKRFVKEYKALEEFKSLYNSLEQIKKETDKVCNDNEEKIREYGIRDKKYDNIKLSMVNAIDIDKKCSYEIDKQNKYFNELMSKINDINSYEYVTRKLKGIDHLIGYSLKYMGLIILSPLCGLIPGIAMQTLATKKMISNVYNKLHFEKVKHIRYEAINYDSELNHHIVSIGYTEELIDDTIRDVKRLKEDFMMIYNSDISGYEDTLKKIEKIENKLLHNQNKVSIVKKNLKKSKKLNEDKMIKVRELNNN